MGARVVIVSEAKFEEGYQVPWGVSSDGRLLTSSRPYEAIARFGSGNYMVKDPEAPREAPSD